MKIIKVMNCKIFAIFAIILMLKSLAMSVIAATANELLSAPKGGINYK